MRRIDYYPDEAARALIERLRRPNVGGDASSTINRIIADWAAGCGNNQTRVPEFLQSTIARKGSPLKAADTSPIIKGPR